MQILFDRGILKILQKQIKSPYFHEMYKTIFICKTANDTQSNACGTYLSLIHLVSIFVCAKTKANVYRLFADISHAIRVSLKNT